MTLHELFDQLLVPAIHCIQIYLLLGAQSIALMIERLLYFALNILIKTLNLRHRLPQIEVFMPVTQFFFSNLVIFRLESNFVIERYFFDL